MGTLIGVHGDSGHGKTGLIGSWSDWLQDSFPGSVLRLITADNISTIEPYIDAGFIDAWQTQLWDHPFEVLNWASQGYWPEDPKRPNCKLLPPTADTWKRVKIVAFDGSTHNCDALMKLLGDLGGEGKYLGPGTRTAKANKEGEADLISFKDGEYGVGGNSLTHYNIVQQQMRKFVYASSGLPVPSIWTFLTVKAVEDNRPIFGPQLAGKAATSKVQSWFDSLIHAHTEVGPKNEIIYKLYLKEHVDPKVSGQVPFKALQRIPLPLLDPKVKGTIEKKWNDIIPTFIEWTNDSKAAHKYMEVRRQMREAAKEIILKSKATN